MTPASPRTSGFHLKKAGGPLGLLAGGLGSSGALILASILIRDRIWFVSSNDDEVLLLGIFWAALCLLPPYLFSRLFSTVWRPAEDDPVGLLSLSTGRPRRLILSLFFLLVTVASYGSARYFSSVTLAELLPGASGGVDLGDGETRLSVMGNQNEAVMLASARSSSPAVRERFFKRAAQIRTLAEYAVVSRLLDAMLQGADLDSAEAAARVIGTMTDRMSMKVDWFGSIREIEEGVDRGVFLWLKAEKAKLTDLYRKTGRVGFIEALVWYRDPALSGLFVSTLDRADAPSTVRSAAAHGLALSAENPDVPVLSRLLGAERDPEVKSRLLWALALLGGANDPESAGAIDDAALDAALRETAKVLKSGDTILVCAALGTLAAFEDARSTAALCELFDSDAANGACPSISFRRPAGSPVGFVKEGEIRILLLNMMADIAVGNRELASWLAGAVKETRWSNPVLFGLQKLNRSVSTQNQ